ncbi:hypothetical protein C6361_32610 [Plantactinospora sp. BC1]|uniref:hypothetical protein n=1 Tax=Plantactinospora sp. BC1 TaxID=2108470 RepID=UPI000D16ACB6|nr:hypothetical protein [Plantactinospora sp. BC1]AVT33404.1 hypothetical protein C6361_32610 [Plantactinospora sp. BC1]
MTDGTSTNDSAPTNESAPTNDGASATLGRWRPVLVRGGLALLGILHVSWGVPAVLAPRWFFDNFPGFGLAWTAGYPPYNSHLMTDVGAAFLTLGVMLLAAARFDDRRVTAVVLTGLLIFSTVHLVFHLGHVGTLSSADLLASRGTLLLGVLGPGALLMLDRHRRA